MEYKAEDVPVHILSLFERLARKHYPATWRIAVTCMIAGYMIRGELDEDYQRHRPGGDRPGQPIEA